MSQQRPTAGDIARDAVAILARQPRSTGGSRSILARDKPLVAPGHASGVGEPHQTVTAATSAT
eukprot:11662572-Prorocentrum_lima.AAC.1